MKTHNLTVEGIGDFVFKHRTLRTSAMVLAEYEKITGNVENPSAILQTLATYLSVLKILIYEAPEDFDMDAMDPSDPDSFKKLKMIYTALVGAEERFRGGAKEKSETTGEETGGDDKAVVPEAVQSSA